MDERSRGTEWGIWDLHVHTPSSIVQYYGGDDDATWAKYIDELENLPSEFRVLGINDYWFLDGYRRLVAEREQGRLKNIDAIFPIIELRLDQFSGVGGPWKRVNLHVIFDPALDPEVIEQQFINAISNEFSLGPGVDGVTWSGAITKESLADLGRMIKASVPPDQLKNYGSDLQEGFDNLVVPLRAVKDLLGKSYLYGRTLVGIGRAEWADIKWAGGSIASKKSVINFADLVFTASQDISTWPSLVNGLRDSNVTHKLLDCSDAHHWADSDQFERIGRCNTWINASPSFAGLAHALNEFDERVFVGLEPPVLARMRRHPNHFIDRLTISSADPAEFSAFNYEMPLNSGFVAVIGNKGQGKSAFLDSIALAGNSARTEEFAFLNRKRFLSPANRTASNYYSEISWHDGAARRRDFGQGFDSAHAVQVEYLPQAYVERVCTADPQAAGEDEFESELRSILFTHIPDDERAGEGSFDDLLARRSMHLDERMAAQRRELSRLVDEYLKHSRFRAAHRSEDIQAKIVTKTAEVAAAEADLEAARGRLAAFEAVENDDAALQLLRDKAAKFEDEQGARDVRLQEHLQAAGVLDQRLLRWESSEQQLARLSLDVEALNREIQQLAEEVQGTAPSAPLVVLHVDRGAMNDLKTAIESRKTAVGELVKKARDELAEGESGLLEVRADLAARDSERELARQQVMQLSSRVADLVGEGQAEDSLTWLKDLLRKVEAVPAMMESALEGMIAASSSIHDSLVERREAVASLYAPAERFIAGSAAVRQADLRFKADLRTLPSLTSLGSQIDARKSPDLPNRISDMPSNIDANSWDLVEIEVRGLVDRLSRERGQITGNFRDPASALKSGYDIREFLEELLDLRWIEVRFGLSGGGLPLSQLSPGQRGLILVLFYLVVDRRETPLLLDQPEENLDNEAISDLLVPALKEAAGRRQTIVVTHNANLAVVGDADQIVHCRLQDGVFSVNGGSIADLGTARFAVDVLEGRMPSFTKRRLKWEVFPELASD